MDTHTHTHNSSGIYFSVTKRLFLDIFPSSFLQAFPLFPKLLIPTLPLTLMTLIKHDYLITIYYAMYFTSTDTSDPIICLTFNGHQIRVIPVSSVQA